MSNIPTTLVARLGLLASHLNEDAHRYEDMAYHHFAEDVEDAARCVELIQLLKKADNHSHYSCVMVSLSGKPLTTIGNLLAETGVAKDA